MQIIAYINADGGVSIVVPAPGARRQVIVTEASFVPRAVEGSDPVTYEAVMIPAEVRDETDEEFVAWVASKDVPAGIDYKIADISSVPSSDDALPAWFSGLGKKAGTGIGHDAWSAQEATAAAARNAALQTAHDTLAAQLDQQNAAALAAWVAAHPAPTEDEAEQPAVA